MTGVSAPADIQLVEPFGDRHRILHLEADPSLHRDLGRFAARQQHVACAHRAARARSNPRAFTAAGKGSDDRADCRAPAANLGGVGSGRSGSVLGRYGSVRMRMFCPSAVASRTTEIPRCDAFHHGQRPVSTTLALHASAAFGDDESVDDQRLGERREKVSPG
jgi:hypothetical protein